MATANEAKFHEASDSVLPGKAGVRFDGALFQQAKHANIHAETAKKGVEVLLDRLAAGATGIRFEGDLYGILRRTEFNTAVIPQLVAALANVSGGEKFDEAKLLKGISDAVFEASKAGAEAGVAAGIEGIDTTVTIKQEEAK